jgi:hypothetical protein
VWLRSSGPDFRRLEFPLNPRHGQRPDAVFVVL